MTSTLAPARGLLFAAGLFVLSAISCAHGLGGEAISFRVDCNVPDATVWVDDVLVGKATDRIEGFARHEDRLIAGRDAGES